MSLTENEKKSLREQVAYNNWMRSVCSCPAQNFKIERADLENGPVGFPWNSKLFNLDAKNFVLSQTPPLFERSLEEIERERFEFSPEGQREGAFIFDTLLSKGVEAAKAVSKEFKKNR